MLFSAYEHDQCQETCNGKNIGGANRGIVLVVGFDLSMDVQGSEGWLHINRRQIIVLEISDGLIVKISDYW